MDRREVLKTSTMLLGYALTAGTAAALIGGCKASAASKLEARDFVNG